MCLTILAVEAGELEINDNLSLFVYGESGSGLGCPNLKEELKAISSIPPNLKTKPVMTCELRQNKWEMGDFRQATDTVKVRVFFIIPVLFAYFIGYSKRRKQTKSTTVKSGRVDSLP